MKHSTSLRHLYHLFNETTLLLGLLFLVLVVVGEAFRRANLSDSLEFWTVIPPLLFPIWVHYWNTWDPILWIKTISLIPVAVIWCSIVRIGIDEYWTRLGSFLVLSTNIAEAVVKDALSKRERTTWNPLNALSGVLLIVSELPTLHTIRISEDGMREFLWSHGPSWIIAYTIWNFMFVYNNYPYAFGRHTAVLLAPLVLVCINGWDTWLQARGYTLAFYFLIRCTIYNKLRSMTDVHIQQTVERTRALQVVSFGCVFILVAVNSLAPTANKNDLYLRQPSRLVTDQSCMF